MATAGDELTTYQSGGDGGKLRKRPIRRSSQTTPYDRPPIAIRNNNNNPSFFAKLVDPASRLIYAGADRLFGVFRKRIPTVPAQRQLEVLCGLLKNQGMCLRKQFQILHQRISLE
ncbi:hypothetical protein HanRHA438_Chr07g0312291 [Helianthus annuus]|nr:hypothetical protein HanPSC8_Chr07g0292741 [Helianthus annuus]KAJ0908605.1 hypothetical protein HanRHA438_Chr07g0312291 [Helianthus annuus]